MNCYKKKIYNYKSCVSDQTQTTNNKLKPKFGYETSECSINKS